MNTQTINIIKFSSLTILVSCMFACSAKENTKMMTTTNVTQNELMPCPSSPNCVSSMSKPSSDSYVKPFTLKNTSVSAKESIKKQILTMPRATLVKNDNQYMHFTFKSKLFGFVDDVQLLFKDNTVHIRSASRTGYSDLGVNKKRVENIRKALIKQGIIQP